MKGTVHPRRLLLCLVLVPALLAGLGAWQSWRAEQQAERLGAAQQRVERALAEARALPPRASVRVDGRAYVRDLALARLDEQLADTRTGLWICGSKRQISAPVSGSRASTLAHSA
nr:hypothetical protein [Pseudomonas aeruginosa]